MNKNGIFYEFYATIISTLKKSVVNIKIVLKKIDIQTQMAHIYFHTQAPAPIHKHAAYT